MDPQSLAQHVAGLRAAERRTPEEVAARQAEVLVRIVGHHVEQTPHFARRMAEAKLVPDDVVDATAFRTLPLLTRRDIQTANDFYADDYPDEHGEIGQTQTSGSTGEPVIVRKTELNQMDLKAITMRDHYWHRRDFRWRFCSVRAHLNEISELPDWGPPAGWLHETGPSMGIPNWLGIPEQVEAIRKFKAESLLIHPSNLDGLIDHLERDGSTIDGIKDLRTIGETLSTTQRERSIAFFGIDPVDVYSSNELGYIALQCPDSGLYHVMAETMLIEILNDDGQPCRPGEIGRVVATDLRNWATPLIRYQIADHAEASEPCPCGRGLPTIRRIVGRTRNLIARPDGSRAWAYLGGIKFREVAPIIQYQFVQHDLERIEARIFAERRLTEGEEANLRAQIISALGPFEVAFTWLDERIPPSAAGKFEEFVCKVPT